MIRFVFVAVFCAVAAVQAQDVTASAGSFAAGVYGTRAAGLCGAQTAAPAATEASLFNPAALASMGIWAATYSMANGGPLPEQHAAAAGRLPGKPWALGVSWNRLGDVGYAENAVFLSGAYSRGFVSLGANYKFRFVDTEGGTGFRDPENGLQRRVTALALGWMGFDAGAIIAPFGPRYRLGLLVRDLFSRISWESQNAAGTAQGEYAEYLPVGMRYGFYFDPDPFLDFHVDFEPALYHDGHSTLATGLEAMPFALLSEGPAKRYLKESLALRLGYSRMLFEEDPAHSLALGLGLAMVHKGMTLAADIAYALNFGFEGSDPLRVGLRVMR